jgi:RNA polymerase sigma factor (sigma-70 family)
MNNVIDIEKINSQNNEPIFVSYMNSIKNIPRLDRTTEIKLANIIKTSNNQEEIQKAINTFTEANLKLVVKYAIQLHKKIQNHEFELPLMDLIEEGNLGLIDAIKKYDPNIGMFSSYAIHYIKRYMQRANHKYRFIKIPEHHHAIIHKINEIKRKGEDITNEHIKQIAKEFNYNESHIKLAIKCNKINAQGFGSLEYKSEDGDTIDFMETYQSQEQTQIDDIIEKEDNINYVMQKITKLNKRDQEIIFSKFFADRPVVADDLAKLWGISTQRISQIITKTLKSIKTSITNDQNNNHKNNKENNKLSYQELFQLSEDIRNTITEEQSVTLNQFKTLIDKNVHKLGYRKSKAIIKENKLLTFFPDEIFNYLKIKVNQTYKNTTKLNQDDINFLQNNHNKDAKWLAQRFYTSPRRIRDIAKNHNITLQKTIHVYSPKEDQFIKDNLDKTWKWISEKLNVSEKSAASRGKYLKVKMISAEKCIPVQLTQEQITFIKNNTKNGKTWIAKKLNVSTRVINRYAKLHKIKINPVQKYFINGKMGIAHNYSKKDDSFINLHLDKGISWLAKQIGVSNKSMNNRIKKLGLFKKYMTIQKELKNKPKSSYKTISTTSYNQYNDYSNYNNLMKQYKKQ